LEIAHLGEIPLANLATNNKARYRALVRRRPFKWNMSEQRKSILPNMDSNRKRLKTK
jgi:hypothetical protein